MVFVTFKIFTIELAELLSGNEAHFKLTELAAVN